MLIFGQRFHLILQVTPHVYNLDIFTLRNTNNYQTNQHNELRIIKGRANEVYQPWSAAWFDFGTYFIGYIYVLHSGQQLVTAPSTQQNQKNIKLKQTSDKSFESI